jgi:Tfp pilus assembly protein PilF
VRLDPAAPIYDTRLGTVQYLSGNLSAAESSLLNALRKDSAYAFAHRQLAEVYAVQHRCEDAMKEVRREPELQDESGSLATAAALCGDTTTARRWIAEGTARARSGKPLDGFRVAMACAALNDRAGVFQWLDAALQDHAGLIFMLRRHPAFERYRDDPRFKAVMRQVYGT